jgi:hypothetical protein
MKPVRILIAAVAITVFKAFVGAVTCGGVFSWVYALEPTNVWKPMAGPPPVSFFIGSLILNVIFVAIYAMLKKAIPGTNILLKGLVFGLFVWALGVLPGMFATYTFMTVAPTVVIYWTVLAIVTTPIQGLIAAAIYGQ